MTTPQPPPEAKLITALRRDMILSMREAARRAGMSAAAWTQNEQGYRKVAPGITIPIRATDEKLARMALVTGGKPEQLRDAGRGDAAAILARLLAAPPEDRLEDALRNSRDLSEAQKRRLIELVRQNPA